MHQKAVIFLMLTKFDFNNINRFVLEVKRFEEEKNQVLIYFTKLANEQICAPFVISESNKIEDHNNSTVKIYDYYRPELEASEVNTTKLDRI